MTLPPRSKWAVSTVFSLAKGKKRRAIGVLRAGGQYTWFDLYRDKPWFDLYRDKQDTSWVTELGQSPGAKREMMNTAAGRIAVLKKLGWETSHDFTVYPTWVRKNGVVGVLADQTPEPTEEEKVSEKTKKKFKLKMKKRKPKFSWTRD